MANTATARRYALALFELGDQENLLDSLRSRMDELDRMVGSEPAIMDLFQNPVYSVDEKKAVLKTFSDKTQAPPLLLRFLDLLAVKNRLIFLPEIAESFRNLVDEAKGRQPVRVHVARELSKGQFSAVQSGLKKVLKKEIQLHVVVDPALIGGMVIQAGNRLFDASIRGQLSNLKKDLLA